MNMKMYRRPGVLLALVVFGLCLIAGQPFPGAHTAAAQASRPNILLIVTDDQRYDTMNYMPRTKARIFDEGITFSNAYVSTPVC